jgi:hypothetical protein
MDGRRTMRAGPRFNYGHNTRKTYSHGTHAESAIQKWKEALVSMKEMQLTHVLISNSRLIW